MVPAGVDSRVGEILAWVHEASNPYLDWFWGSPTEAVAQLKEQLIRPNSELSEKRAVCLSEAGQIIGGYIALPGHELPACRKADLLTLSNHLKRAPNEGLIARMRQARSVFASVGSDEFYLSRIGVIPSARGKGTGKKLLGAFLEDGRRRGFRQFRLDVSADNERAIRLYRVAGFVMAGESAIPTTPIRYFSMTLAD
ncbi:MAG TPA: GNAT family N-acetyltransferase [Verrucomicrobiae bacterium]|nr:GNAT family N-acetyltransferase [Verrucomicrobiae bacterium]